MKYKNYSSLKLKYLHCISTAFKGLKLKIVGFLMLMALPYFEQTQKWTVELPNSFNFSFHFPSFLKIYMLSFLGGKYCKKYYFFKFSI